MQYNLMDVVWMNREHPETFKIPSYDARANLVPGDLAKVCLIPPEPVYIQGRKAHPERVWVEVLEHTDDRGYVGSLRNEPVLIEEMSFGDLVSFRPQHILDVAVQEEEVQHTVEFLQDFVHGLQAYVDFLGGTPDGYADFISGEDDEDWICDDCKAAQEQ